MKLCEMQLCDSLAPHREGHQRLLTTSAGHQLLIRIAALADTDKHPNLAMLAASAGLRI